MKLRRLFSNPIVLAALIEFVIIATIVILILNRN